MENVVDRNEVAETTGRRVRELRTDRGMSQQSLADAVGIHRITLTRLESGQHLPDFDVVCRLADALGVALDDLRKS